MPSSSWTLESELCKLSKTANLSDAVEALQLLPAGEVFHSLKTVEDWNRGGAETFIYQFKVLARSNQESRYLLKACVAFDPHESVDQTLTDWIERRILLSTNGIRTPKLYASLKGVILEEHIPYKIQQLVDASQMLPRELLFDLTYLAGILAKLGFEPTEGFFADLRSHGNDVVVVDFGQDLGEARNFNRLGNRHFELLIDQLKCWKVEATESLLEEMYSHYLILIDKGGKLT